MPSSTSQPLLAVTVGDPLGIGPEVFIKALANAEAVRGVRLLALGPVAVLDREAKRLGARVKFRAVEGPAQARHAPGTVDVIELGFVGLDQLPQGIVHATAGKASVEYVIRAAELALEGAVDAVVTGPIHKEAVRAGGFHQYIGNTEIFEDVCTRRTGQDFRGKCMTMLISKNLRVAHVTRHIPFKDISAKLTRESVAETIRLTAHGMASLGVAEPRVGVAGLNPHNGEHGLMGREELDVIGPACDQARAEGLPVEGPIPADSIFFKAIGGGFDAVVAMYHDQGHIAVKTYGFEESITVSLGLPVIRTSVDHGTAFDIAGKGLAAEASMVEALKLARQIVQAGRWDQGVAATATAQRTPVA
ncbi:MAG: 4-hydroxythreonine-4-phosphate dehydrogenase PdxA [Candidatus Lambdaproteobacteria bacterium]|nr:4-hydroxythreonine-4-phosphate dehydrogenase PdxA [Candidatus Lambdaproteobacteria bacterium]